MFILLLIIFLPLIEIAGFILIGGKIGAGLSLLWVIADAVIGFTLLTTLGKNALRKFEKAAATGEPPIEEMFDGICIIVGALLLIFPGFISDFLALPLLIPPVRHWIFLFLKHKHGSVLNDLGKTSQGFTYWYYKSDTTAAKTIEGDFKSIDEDKRLH
jgi:UPF0716 family protein affecting phage T7 exclusion